MAESGTVRVFDPTGHPFVEEHSLARRPESLAGLRPGILENGKANARLLMESVVEAMRERIDLGALTIESKPVAGPPSRATMRSLTENCDFVLVGSCD
jgi:hypothetical protein